MFKRTNSSSDWVIFDIMRGLTVSGSNEDKYIYPNNNNAEGGLEQIGTTPTGFITEGSWGEVNASGGNYIYMAIRRGPMATPTSATDVFAIDGEVDTSPTPPSYNSGFPVDLGIFQRNVNSSGSKYVFDRPTGNTKGLITNDIAAEQTLGGGVYALDRNDGVGSYTGTAYPNAYAWMWRRAPGFFDIATYNGTGGTITVNHNLGAVPKMIWIKRRDSSQDWIVYAEGNDVNSDGEPWTDYLRLDSSQGGADADYFNDTAPTATTFQVKGYGPTGSSGGKFIAYLFGEVAGISKFGTYTGNGSTQTINVGFNPRFILSKKAINGNGHWYFFDTVRGITAGNDPWLTLNTTDAQYTSADTIDLVSNGFTVNDSNTNSNSDGYIYYSIA